MKYLSVCSGIEAASVAWHPLGWEPVAFSEVDPFASAVLAHRYPHIPNLGDMTKYANWKLPAFDLLVGGTPCQSFSVAGLRKGLEDPRGNLMLVYLGILDRFRPRWCIWENVPGVLSSNEGRDFGTFLGSLGELGYGFAYRVLDAQFVRVESHPHAVPQRRQRVFVVGCAGGDWRSAAEVLLEPESVRRDSPPRRQARKATSPGAGSGAASGNQVIPVPKSWGINSDAVDRSGEHADGTAANRSGLGISLDVQPTLKARPTNSVTTGATVENLDYSVPHIDQTEIYAIQDTRDIDGDQGGVGVSQEGVSYTLTTLLTQGVAILELNMSDSVITIDFQGGKGRSIVSDDGLCPPLLCGGSHVVAVPGIPDSAVAYNSYQRTEAPVASPQSAEVTQQVTAVYASSLAVRRLTPRECERLQGFPDDWTLVPYKGKLAVDGNRYKTLGNSMAVNVMRFIGERIYRHVEAFSKK